MLKYKKRKRKKQERKTTTKNLKTTEVEDFTCP
jgi:hypothetical protein